MSRKLKNGRRRVADSEVLSAIVGRWPIKQEEENAPGGI